MALSRFLTPSLVASLLLLLLLHLTEAHLTTMSMEPAPTPSPVPHTIDCGGACEVRCKLSSRPNRCKRACGSCCARCNCVPPGTYGNYQSCPCYAGLTTGRNHIPKCP